MLEQAALALLGYIEEHPEGFRILVRDSPIGSQGASFQSIIGDTARRVEGILADQFTARGLDQRTAPMYAQMLVGMVGTTGQWWLSADRRPDRALVAAHIVNLAWNGLSGLDETILDGELVSTTYWQGRMTASATMAPGEPVNPPRL